VLNHLQKLIEPLGTARVREGALRILSEIGLAVPSAQVRDRLADAGLRIAGGRVFLDADRTVAYIERQRSQQTAEPADAPLRLHSGSHALFHFYSEARCISPLTVAALEPYTKLLGALNA
jgi:trimethylamine:corrinoid methyltransferase-like protein